MISTTIAFISSGIEKYTSFTQVGTLLETFFDVNGIIVLDDKSKQIRDGKLIIFRIAFMGIVIQIISYDSFFISHHIRYLQCMYY